MTCKLNAMVRTFFFKDACEKCESWDQLTVTFKIKLQIVY